MCSHFIIIIFEVCIQIRLNGRVIRLYNAVRFDFHSLFSPGSKVVVFR